jgi:hypothetical protein
MTGHQFESNLYHKEKEKSKKSTKYCGHGRLPIQYLDVLRNPRLMPPGQNQAVYLRTTIP